MNILPKKRWHVRTKENIARVRRDEAEAEKKEKERLRKIKLAEQEARTLFLRENAKSSLPTDELNAPVKSETALQSNKGEHINFFKEIEEGLVAFTGSNAEYEKEKKEEKEKYEKQIGYLTYLGQDTNESTGKVSWYNKIPERSNGADFAEVCADKKHLIDPLNKIKPYVSVLKNTTELKLSEYKQKDLKRKRKIEGSGDVNEMYQERIKKKTHKKLKKHSIKKKKKIKKCKGKKHRKRSEDSTSSNEDDDDGANDSSQSEDDRTTKNMLLERLRVQRVQREAEEKLRAQQHLAKLRGEALPEEKKSSGPIIKQKYNSQYNPHLAKQNFCE